MFRMPFMLLHICCSMFQMPFMFKISIFYAPDAIYALKQTFLQYVPDAIYALKFAGPSALWRCDHALVVGFLILRRECRDPPGDRSVHLLLFAGRFSSLWRPTCRFSLFFVRLGTSSKNQVFSPSSKIDKNNE